MYFAYYMTGIIMIPVFIFAMICQSSVKKNYKKYSQVSNLRGLTGAQAAYELLQLNGVNDVKIDMISGNLTDNFDPRDNTIHLSQGVYNSNSISAVGIACHEAGHAVQHAKNYAPLKLRNAVIPATRIGSTLGVPLALIGMFIYSDPLIYAGIILYSLVALFQLLTLPVEFNASKRAVETIEQNGFLTGGELVGAKKVLTSAALTYVAALASAIATILRLVILTNRRN